MGSEDPAVSYDSWHWKSTRTNPVGYSDDQWWNVLEDPTAFDSSRRSDAKDSGGGDTDNVNEAKDGPKFMSAKGTAETFIFAGDEFGTDTTTLAAGDIIPGFVIAKAVGSRVTSRPAACGATASGSSCSAGRSTPPTTMTPPLSRPNRCPLACRW